MTHSITQFPIDTFEWRRPSYLFFLNQSNNQINLRKWGYTILPFAPFLLRNIYNYPEDLNIAPLIQLIIMLTIITIKSKERN